MPERHPPEWPHQLRAAGALVLIGTVWLLVLPLAAGAYGALRALDLARRALGRAGGERVPNDRLQGEYREARAHDA